MAQNDITSVKDSDIISAHVSEMFPLLFEASKDSKTTVCVGSALSTYRIDDDSTVAVSEYESYPLLINNNIVGIIDVSRENGNISQVSLGINYAPELQQSLTTHGEDSFAIFYAENGIYIKFSSSESITRIKAYNDIEPLSTMYIEENAEIGYTSISQETAVSIQPRENKRALLFKTLNVTNVSNSTTPCCGGICWAASIAIMANYHLGTSYTALQIHNLFGCLTSNYHNEEKSRIQQLGMSAGGPYYSTGSYRFTFSTLYDCIEADMLLLLDLQDYDKGAAHNVVSYGYFATSDSSTTYFYYMDPNTGGKISSFPSSPSATVYIPLSGYNYAVHCYITAY